MVSLMGNRQQACSHRGKRENESELTLQEHRLKALKHRSDARSKFECPKLNLVYFISKVN